MFLDYMFFAIVIDCDKSVVSDHSQLRDMDEEERDRYKDNK